MPRIDRSRRLLRHSLAFSAGTAILLSSAAAGAYVDPACADGTNVSACCRADQTLVSGSAGPDIINASTSDDSSCVLADAADDIVQGRSGADSLVGGVGNDQLRGRAGDDKLIGGPGDDELIGNRGYDELIGNEGADQIRGGKDGDLIEGGPGADRIFGGAGNDVIYPGPGATIVRAGTGDDRVILRSLCEMEPGKTLDGGDGTDTLILPFVPQNRFQEPLQWFFDDPDEFFRFLVVLAGTSNFEQFGFSDADRCNSACAPENCEPGVDSIDPLDHDPWEGQIFDIARMPAEPGFDPVSGEELDVPYIEYCPNDLRPSFTDAECEENFEVGPVPPDGTLCEITGTEPLGSFYIPVDPSEVLPGSGDGTDFEDPNVGGDGDGTDVFNPDETPASGDGTDVELPPENRCAELEPVRYCVRRDETDIVFPGDPLYLPVPEEVGELCEAVPANPFCRPGEDDCNGLDGEARGTVSCTTSFGDPTQVAGSVGQCPADAPICLDGFCQTCVQVTECPDDFDPNEIREDPEFEGEGQPSSLAEVPLSTNLVDEPTLESNALCSAPATCLLPPGATCRGNTCRVATTPICPASDAACAANSVPVAIDPCEWDTAENGQGPARFGAGSGGGFPNDLPAEAQDPDVRPTRWSKRKGNKRFNVQIDAGAYKRADFDTKFSEAAPFDVGAGADFKLSATIWEQTKEIIRIGANARANTCGYQFGGSVRVMGNVVQVGGENLEFGQDAPKLFGTCPGGMDSAGVLKSDIDKLRQEANERMYDMQVLLDYYERHGDPVLYTGDTWIESEIQPLHDFVLDNIAVGGAPDPGDLRRETQYRKSVAAYNDEVEAFNDNLLIGLENTFGLDEVPEGAVEYGETLTATKPWRRPRRLIGAELGYPIGPFRVGLEIGASAFLGVDISGELDYRVTLPAVDPKVSARIAVAPLAGADAQAALFGSPYLFVGVGRA